MSIREEGWTEMLDKPKSAGVASWAWKKSLREDFFPAKEEQVQPFDRRSAFRESLCQGEFYQPVPKVRGPTGRG